MREKEEEGIGIGISNGWVFGLFLKFSRRDFHDLIAGKNLKTD